MQNQNSAFTFITFNTLQTNELSFAYCQSESINKIRMILSRILYCCEVPFSVSVSPIGINGSLQVSFANANMSSAPCFLSQFTLSGRVK